VCLTATHAVAAELRMLGRPRSIALDAAIKGLAQDQQAVALGPRLNTVAIQLPDVTNAGDPEEAIPTTLTVGVIATVGQTHLFQASACRPPVFLPSRFMDSQVPNDVTAASRSRSAREVLR
jgi:hypothetical protein